MTSNTSNLNTEKWINVGLGLAPIGLLTALLVYFGTQSSKKYYQFFGVDVNAVGLSTRDFVVGSLTPLLVPIMVAATLALPLFPAHTALMRAVRGPHRSSRVVRVRRAARTTGVVVSLAGILVVACGFGLVLAYATFPPWPLYALVTPACFVVGICMATYGIYLADQSLSTGRGQLLHAIHCRRRSLAVIAAFIAAGGLFWATSTLAAWSGNAQAISMSKKFGTLPSVILDTKERLYVKSVSVIETALPEQADQSFRYRYRNLRLLVEGSGRMFLVPEVWSNNGITLVVPLDDSVRVQFKFENPA